jgi:hypothetical protein
LSVCFQQQQSRLRFQHQPPTVFGEQPKSEASVQLAEKSIIFWSMLKIFVSVECFLLSLEVIFGFFFFAYLEVAC